MSVAQKHEFGCGAACLAFVMGWSYESVVGKLGVNKAMDSGYLCRDLTQLLNKNGKPHEYSYLKPRLKARIYRQNTVVFIARSKYYPAGHYLVRYQDTWMDPWVNLSSNQDIRYAESGFRRRLPGRPIYALFSK